MEPWINGIPKAVTITALAGTMFYAFAIGIMTFGPTRGTMRSALVKTFRWYSLSLLYSLPLVFISMISMRVSKLFSLLVCGYLGIGGGVTALAVYTLIQVPRRRPTYAVRIKDLIIIGGVVFYFACGYSALGIKETTSGRAVWDFFSALIFPAYR